MTGKMKEGAVHHPRAGETPFIPTTPSSLLYLCTYSAVAQTRVVPIVHEGAEVIPRSLTWSCCANAIATVCTVVGFIKGYPKFHFISQSLEEELSIFLKPLNYSIILPPTNVLQRLWEVPMIESYLWGKTARNGLSHSFTFRNKDNNSASFMNIKKVCFDLQLLAPVCACSDHSRMQIKYLFASVSVSLEHEEITLPLRSS